MLKLTVFKKIDLSIAIGFILFIYLLLRIIIMPISDDEAISVDMHASMSWWGVLITGQQNIDWAPNNHVLNTLFMKLEIAVFGMKDWAIRLHVLGAFAICFIYSRKLMQGITTSKLRQSLYLLILFLNPYLLDFFAIARGYALSIAAFTAAFYYFISYCEDHSLTTLRNIFIALFFAVWANLSALYFLLLFVVLILIEVYKKVDRDNWRTHLLFIVIGCCFIAAINFAPLLKTMTSTQTYGGKTGLFQDCIVYYINQFIHMNPHIDRHEVFTPAWRLIEVYGVVILLLWIMLHLISLLFSPQASLAKKHRYTFFLLFGIALISKLLFCFNGTPYPTGRTQLLFSIPFYLGICIAFERIIVVKKSGMIALWATIAILIWHFASSLTFENTIEWWQNGDAKRVTSYFEEEFKKSPPAHELSLGAESWQYHSLAFYTNADFKGKLKAHWTDLSTNNHYDYLLVPFHLKDKVWPEYELVNTFKHCFLYKIKKQ